MKTAVARTPQHGDIWKHKGGRMFMVLCIANQFSANPKYPPMVVYVGTNIQWDQLVYACPLSRWEESYWFVRGHGASKFGMRHVAGNNIEVYDTRTKKTIATLPESNSTYALQITELLNTEDRIHPGQWRQR